MRLRIASWVVGLVVLVAQTGWAEVRFYLVPRIGTPSGPTTTSFRPKYTEPGALGALGPFSWSGLSFHTEDAYLIAADVTPEQHAALAAQSDVLSVPNALDSNVSALAVTNIQNRLEALNMPAEWVNTSLTYRQVVRALGKMIQIRQRYYGMFETNPFATVTLSTRWNQLTEQQKSEWRAVADSLGIDYSAVTNTMTLRQILRLLGDQLPPFVMRGEVL